MGIVVVEDRAVWNSVVERSEIKYFTYLYEWMECFEEVYDEFEKIPLGNQVEGELISVFPLMSDKKQRILMSPHFGGWGTSTNISDLPLYLEYVDDVARKLKVKKIELYPPPVDKAGEILKKYGYDINSTTPYLVLGVDGASFDEIMMKRFKADVRQSIRRANRDGVKVELLPITEQSVKRFYPFYAHVMVRNKAEIQFPQSLFLGFVDRMRDYTEIRIASWEGTDIGGAITFTYADVVMAWFVVTHSKYYKLRASNLLFADVIKKATETGLRGVDMGPSGWNDSNFEFKRRMGAEPEVHINAVKYVSWDEKIKTYYRDARRLAKERVRKVIKRRDSSEAH